MAHKLVLSADDIGTLDDKLREFGVHAPPRLERRGRQQELDRWIMHRALLLARERLSYPVNVFQGETPDFYLRSGDTLRPVEVTEGAGQEEQQAMTEHSRSGGVRHIDLMDPDRAKKFAELILKSCRKKSEKNYPPGTVLAICPNTELCAFESSVWLSEAWEAHGMGSSDAKLFDTILIVKDEDFHGPRGAVLQGSFP